MDQWDVRWRQRPVKNRIDQLEDVPALGLVLVESIIDATLCESNRVDVDLLNLFCSITNA